jgi:hypothetical protein
VAAEHIEEVVEPEPETKPLMAVEISAKPSVIKNKQNEATFLTEDKSGKGEKKEADVPKQEAELPEDDQPFVSIPMDDDDLP